MLITVQPEEWDVTRVFKLIARDDVGGDPALLEKFTADAEQALARDLALAGRYAAAPLPLDDEVPGQGPAGRANLAWRRLMARAVRG